MDQKVKCNTLQNNKPRSKMAKEAPLHIIVVQTQHSPIPTIAPICLPLEYMSISYQHL